MYNLGNRFLTYFADRHWLFGFDGYGSRLACPNYERCRKEGSLCFALNADMK